MRIPSSSFVAAVFGLAIAAIAFFSTAGADEGRPQVANGPRAEAVFAGGCFWCVESDFDKIDGVISTVSGYTGGTLANPTYRDVTYGESGHYEAVRVTYDPTKVTYEELVNFFYRHVDPTDAGGQFCDRGDSYRTAIFVGSAEQRSVAETVTAGIDGSGVLSAPIVTPVKTLGAFYAAEDYHQDYYQKQPVKYKAYRNACGRDRKVGQVWANDPES